MITGASSGVGRALALAFAASTRQLVLVGRDSARLAAVAREVEELGARARCHAADFEARDGVLQLGRDLCGFLPSISLLVHSAGLFTSGGLDATSSDDFDRILDVNLRAPFLLTRELLAPLRQGAGDIVFINSSVVGQRRAGISAYAASKHGLLALADSLRQEINPFGVRVLSVFLGATATPLTEANYARDARPYVPEALLQPVDVARIIHDSVALPRGAEVTDLHLRPAAPHRAP